MQFRIAQEVRAARSRDVRPAETGQKEQFRARFQHAFCRYLEKGFPPEDCFGLIWNEALEAMPLTEADQSELLEELGDWAKAQREKGALHNR